jgi:Zinc-binding loop region of homing endonuclease
MVFLYGMMVVSTKGPHIMPRPRNVPKTLWDKVDVKAVDQCWPWLGWKNEQGYGRFEIDGKAYYAHRAIFQLANPGTISLAAPFDRFAAGFLRHSCDNPSCCNPSHLIIGTHAENMRDMAERKRQKWCHVPSTESPRAKLTAHDVQQIRKQKREGATLNALAMLYDVHRSTIKGVLSARHYADIGD